MSFLLKHQLPVIHAPFTFFIVQLKMLRKSSNFLLLQVVLLYTLESHTERKIYLNFLSILILQQKNWKVGGIMGIWWLHYFLVSFPIDIIKEQCRKLQIKNKKRKINPRLLMNYQRTNNSYSQTEQSPDKSQT